VGSLDLLELIYLTEKVRLLIFLFFVFDTLLYVLKSPKQNDRFQVIVLFMSAVLKHNVFALLSYKAWPQGQARLHVKVCTSSALL
jgi:hypothetical protein